MCFNESKFYYKFITYKYVLKTYKSTKAFVEFE